MKILVALKVVLSEESRACFDPTQGFVVEEPIWTLNPYDEYALEEALRIKNKYADTEISCISVGPENVEQAIRTAFSLGVDRGLHVLAPKNLDPFQTAAIISKAAGKEYDLYLFGKMAVDDEAEMVGALVAHQLELVQLTSVNKIDYDGQKKLKANRRIEGWREVLETSLPALVTFARIGRDIRYPKMQDQLSAMKKKIERIDLKEGDIPDARFKVVKLTGPKPKGMENPDWLSLSAKEKISKVMSGGVTSDKKGELIEGEPQKLAEKLVDFMVQRNTI